jgi:ribonuclease D
VFHAAEYDVICLKRDFGFEIKNLFDTMAAARILGREAVGLGAMLQAEFGVQLNKRHQRANWGQRPLPQHLLDYASLDTRYLIRLRERLRAELDRAARWELAKEDFERLCAIQVDESSGDDSPDEAVDVWRVSGSYDLTPQQAAVLLELCRYREHKAQALDRPLFKVIGDRTLMEIALEQPASIKALSRLHGMTPKQVKRHGTQLLRAVQRGQKAEPIYPPRASRPNEGYLDRLEALRVWRKRTARRMGVKSDVVLPRDLLFLLAKVNPVGQAELSSVLESAPWRLEKFGGQILAVIEGCSE